MSSIPHRSSKHLNDSGETQDHKILKIQELLKELQFPVAKWVQTRKQGFSVTQNAKALGTGIREEQISTTTPACCIYSTPTGRVCKSFNEAWYF